MDHVPVEVSHPHLTEFFRLLPELNKESARGCVLVSCSYLDQMLLNILLAFFVDHSKTRRLVEGFNPPLGTLSTRVAAARALGLLSEREFKECEILRKIRNPFAHHVHMSFENQQVRDLCECLTMAAQDYDEVVVDARGQYVTAAVAVLLNLNNRAFYVAKKRCVPIDWPT